MTPNLMGSLMDALASVASGANGQDTPPMPPTNTPPASNPSASTTPTIKLPSPATPPFLPNSATMANTNMGDIFKNYQDKLDEYTKNNSKTDEAIRKRLAYTPEQMAQDMVNKQFGKDPTTGKTNWLKAILANVNEVGKGFVTPVSSYQSPLDRARATALKQYEAETGPLVQDARVTAQNNRAALSEIQKTIHDASTSQTQNARIQIQDRLATVKENLESPMAALYAARAEEALAKGEVDKAHQYALQAEEENKRVKTENLKKQGGLTGDAANTKIISEMSPEAQAAWAKTQALKAAIERTKHPIPQGSTTTATIDGAGNKVGSTSQRVYQNAPDWRGLLPPTGTDQQKPAVPGAPISTNTTPSKPQTVPQLADNLRSQANHIATSNSTPLAGRTANTSALPELPPDPSRTWKTPKETYPNATTLPIHTFPDTPPGRNDITDGLYRAPWPGGAKLDPKAAAAANLYQVGVKLDNLISRIPPEQFGAVRGYLNGVLAGKMPSNVLGMPKEIGELVREAQGLSEAAAGAHLGTYNMRNAQMAERLSKELGSTRSDPDAVRGFIRAITFDQAVDVLRTYQSSKTVVSQIPGMTHKEFSAIYEGKPGDKINRSQPTYENGDSKTKVYNSVKDYLNDKNK